MATGGRWLGSVCSCSLEVQRKAGAGLGRDGSSSTVYCASFGGSKLVIGCRVSVTGGRGRLGVGSTLTVVRAVRASGGERKEEKRRVENIPSSPPPASTTTNYVSFEDEGIGKDDQLTAQAIPSEASTAESQNLEGEQEKDSSGSVDSMDEIGNTISELRKERAVKRLQDSASTTNFWQGVGEETRLIDWPVFSKVLGTTGVVVAMILGSSVVLLTVNAVLAASSDFIFNDPAIRDFAKTQLNLFF